MSKSDFQFIGGIAIAALFLFIGVALWAEIGIRGTESRNNGVWAAILVVCLLPLGVSLGAWLAYTAANHERSQPAGTEEK